MDNNFPIANLLEPDVNTSTTDLPSIVEQNYKPFVPKIRIRLRPNSEKPNLSSYANVYGSLVDKSEFENDTLTNVIKNDSSDGNSETKCYKVREDSGGGGGIGGPSGDGPDPQSIVTHSYMVHGINLRARLPKPLNVSRKFKTKEVRIDKKKCKTAYQTENEFINKPSIKSICAKNSYKSYILNSSKNQRKKENDRRKPISKIRNETAGNINLKGIVNYENFLKLSSEIQWQLANLLPNCDKPKSQDTESNCYCTDSISSIEEQPRIYPTVTLNAFNNEFLVKALTKFSMKIGQCDLLNLLTSERENLRSRSLPILNEDLALIDLTENAIKIEDSDISSVTASVTNATTTDATTTLTVSSTNNNNNREDDAIKLHDDTKSNSSICSTETMEMNGTGNLFENLSLKIEQYSNIETKFEETCDKDFVIGTTDIICDDTNEGSSSNDKESVWDSQCDKTTLGTREDLILREKVPPINFSSVPYKEFDTKYTPVTQNLSIDTTNLFHQLKTSDSLDDNRRRRGRKRKCFTISDDILVVPVKRSSRSTAGKRPARLDSESPPTSPNHISNNERKSLHSKFKKQKERTRNNRKSKIKQELSSDELDNIIKLDVRSSKHSVCRDVTKYQKHYPSSPESLPNESDLSPLSKPSPNGSSVMSNFCRSSLASFINDKKCSGHVNSVQALSPSWSCTSESTTPSVKSDYGHVQPTRTSPSFNNNNNNAFGHNDGKHFSESETKPIQGMPPPRQTLTLAAMREKMRAKKLAKEDHRKDSNCSYQMSSTINNLKTKRPKNEFSSLLKEADDESQMMDKLINSSDEIDELLYNSHDSLLEFFMGDDNYDFDGTVEQLSDNNGYSSKSFSDRKAMSKGSCVFDDGLVKQSMSMPVQSESDQLTKKTSTKIPVTEPSDEQVQCDKSIADTIATVLQKLNSSKENGLVVSSSSNSSNSSQNLALKGSAPNAYLVDGNGLSNALSIIQSLNPGAKVTTQQFYLVNSGPQLILQPSPPASVVSDQNQVPLTSQILCAQSQSQASSTTDTQCPLRLQPISSSHSLNLVHSLQSPLPSLFPPQLRFLQSSSLATHSVQSPHNTISLVPSSSSLSSPTNTAVSNTQHQSPKLLFLCPTMASQAPALMTSAPSDQKYLLLSKQPDKQATIQLVSSQGLWQQLNPSIISQSNSNLLVMPPQTINSLDSLLSQHCGLTGPDQQHNKQCMLPQPPGAQSSSSSLIIDSRSLMSTPSQISHHNHDCLTLSSTSHVTQPSVTSYTKYCGPVTEVQVSSPHKTDQLVTQHHCQDISQA